MDVLIRLCLGGGAMDKSTEDFLRRLVGVLGLVCMVLLFYVAVHFILKYW